LINLKVFSKSLAFFLYLAHKDQRESLGRQEKMAREALRGLRETVEIRASQESQVKMESLIFPYINKMQAGQFTLIKMKDK
jgi:hypothetical protein